MFLSLLIFAILPLACFSNPLFTFREENRVARADDESSLRLTELKNALKEKGFGCSVCMTFANVLQDLFVRNATEEEIVKKITSLCIKFKIEDELVCTAVVIEFKVGTPYLSKKFPIFCETVHDRVSYTRSYW